MHRDCMYAWDTDAHSNPRGAAPAGLYVDLTLLLCAFGFGFQLNDLGEARSPVAPAPPQAPAATVSTAT